MEWRIAVAFGLACRRAGGAGRPAPADGRRRGDRGQADDRVVDPRRRRGGLRRRRQADRRARSLPVAGVRRGGRAVRLGGHANPWRGAIRSPRRRRGRRRRALRLVAHRRDDRSRPPPRPRRCDNRQDPFSRRSARWWRSTCHNARPFSDRSPWIWFACAPDRSGCKRLPDVRGWSYRYLPGPETLGMRLQVQADYAKDGALWTARADLGVVGPEEAPIPAFRPPPLPECAKAESPGGGVLEKGLDVETHLYALESGSAPVPSWTGLLGGAIAPLCNDLIVAAPWGAISSVDPSGRTRRHDSAVPMGFEGGEPGPEAVSLAGDRLRVADILLLRRSGERYELFATHHYFAGDCVRFRMSSTTVLREDGAVSVSPSWRTIFDAEPCLPPDGSDWAQAGGRMLADGRGRVLVAVGTHFLDSRVRGARRAYRQAASRSTSRPERRRRWPSACATPRGSRGTRTGACGGPSTDRKAATSSTCCGRAAITAGPWRPTASDTAA